MSKIAYYLQEHLTGEVMTSVDARRYFATDGSIFSIAPSVIVYPRNENDVRKAVRFTWQLAERGRVVPITPRGSGTDQTGAALGNGVMLVFPAHMNRVVELDSKSGVVVVEPGINYSKLQQTLQTHDHFLPPYPASVEYSTVGGAIANNASGNKSVKYGSTQAYVRSLRVVLANGEVIETGRLNKRDLNKKLGLATLEGEIYRAVDTLLEENKELIDKMELQVAKNSAGYSLLDIKHKDGSFDLTPLIIGSQGTLGIVTEATLETEDYNPQTTLIAAHFDSIQKVQQAILDLRQMADLPSAIEMVDNNLLEFIDEINPNQLKDNLQKPFPKTILLVEFDNPSERQQKKLAKRAEKILSKYAIHQKTETDPEQQTKLWKIREASSTLLSHVEGQQKALPIIEDGVVPLDKLNEFLQAVYSLFDQTRVRVAVWGHAGDGNLSFQPHLDLGQVGDRQKMFRLMDEYYKLVIGLGGSISGSHSDGRLRGPYLKLMYGEEIYGLFQKIKQIFDPYGTLNPGVKMDVTIDGIKSILRTDYSQGHIYTHMPRS